MQVEGWFGNILSNLSDEAAQADDALIDLHTFLVSAWIDSNFAETLRSCKVNENDLANGEQLAAFSVCSLDKDRKDQM